MSEETKEPLEETPVTAETAETEQEKTPENQEPEKKAKKKEKKESKQDAVNQPEEDESKPVVDSGLSSSYTDEELLTYANDHRDDFWHTYYWFMAGTFFEASNDNGNMLITDSRIHSLQDVENVWYQ